MNKSDFRRFIHPEGFAEIRKECFEQVNGFQTEWNKYVMENSVKCVIEENLLKPLGRTDKLCNQLESLLDVDPCVVKCAILRNDYFMTEKGEMKMVEYNTIAVSLLAVASEAYKQLGGGVANDPLIGLIDTLKTTAKLHKEQYSLSEQLNILMIMTEKDEKEGNVDQELICDALKGITTINRKSLTDVNLKVNKGHLYYEGELVNVVYLRGGYMEMTEEEFKNRQLIEKSLACKVNNVNVQLFGMKLMQYALSGSSSAPSAYKSLQVRMLPAEEWKGEDDWILKSNSEGGNSCIFELNRVSDITHKRGWIVMERIKADVQNGFTHEIGIYGGIISLSGQLIENCVLGYLVRTKRKEVNESGVNTGFAKVNSLCFM